MSDEARALQLLLGTIHMHGMQYNERVPACMWVRVHTLQPSTMAGGSNAASPRHSALCW